MTDTRTLRGSCEWFFALFLRENSLEIHIFTHNFLTHMASIFPQQLSFFSSITFRRLLIFNFLLPGHDSFAFMKVRGLVVDLLTMRSYLISSFFFQIFCNFYRLNKLMNWVQNFSCPILPRPISTNSHWHQSLVKALHSSFSTSFNFQQFFFLRDVKVRPCLYVMKDTLCSGVIFRDFHS